VWRNGAYAALAVGELDAYRSTCRSFVEKFSATENLALLNHISWACSMGPGAVEDLKGLAGRLERVMGSSPRYHATVNTLGALRYRAGELGPAIDVLEESRALDGQGGSFNDWLFLAMAFHGQGRREDAAAALAKASALIDKLLIPQAPGPSSVRAPRAWFDRLGTDCLRKEAEALLSGN
jgi:hypothetical protein